MGFESNRIAELFYGERNDETQVEVVTYTKTVFSKI